MARRVSLGWRDAHQPGQLITEAGLAVADEAICVGGCNASLLRLLAYIHLDKKPRQRLATRLRSDQRIRQARPV